VSFARSAIDAQLVRPPGRPPPRPRPLKPAGYPRSTDDFTLFDDDPARLLATRDELAAWLAVHRRLRLKDPHAEPRSTLRPSQYLGYRVTREGFAPGYKARGRIPGHLQGAGTAEDARRSRGHRRDVDVRVAAGTSSTR
jgi:hypothetical protein